MTAEVFTGRLVQPLAAEPATRLARHVATGAADAEAVVADHLVQIDAVEPETRALVRIRRRAALRTAQRLDGARLRDGTVPGPLAGVPLVIKDNIALRGEVTSAGSQAHGDVVATRDAEVVRRLRRAGAVVIGRANMDELAMGASTQTSARGRSRNPHDVRRSTGGSSGGCAAAVAAHEVPLAVGTDTGGSVREPAAQCGVYGLAPSPGLVPTTGVVPFAAELDRVGPLARTVPDLALLLGVMAGMDDPTRFAASVLPGSLTGLRVAVVEELSGAANQPGVLAALDRTRRMLAALGARVTEVSVPSAHGALETYMDLTCAAAVPVVAPYVATGLTGPEVNRRYERGVRLLSDGQVHLAVARERQKLLARELGNVLAHHDVLLSPTMPTTAPVLEAATTAEQMADPMEAPYTDCWTVVANLAGLPALSVPSGFSDDDGMPVGVMLMGAPGADALLLRAAAAWELASSV